MRKNYVYNMYLLDKYTSAKVRIIEFFNLKISSKMNEPTTVTFDIPLDEVKRAYDIKYDGSVPALTTGSSVIEIRRNNTVVFTGILWQLNVDSKAYKGSCVAQCFGSLLQRRILRADRIGRNPSQDIPWLLVQANSLESTWVTSDTSRFKAYVREFDLSKIVYKAGSTIFDCLTQILAPLMGRVFFYFTKEKYMVWGQEWSDVETDGWLSYGVDIDSFTTTDDGRWTATKMVTVNRNNVVAESAVVDLGGYGLLEQTYKFTEQDSLTFLSENDIRERQLEARNHSMYIPQVTCVPNTVDMFNESIRLGQAISLELGDLGAPRAATASSILVAFEVNIIEGVDEQVTLTFNDRKLLRSGI